MINILFICSRNKWRSPTAEKVFRNKPGINVRSVGLSQKSPLKLSPADLKWADVVFVMEREHELRIREQYTDLPPIESLEIADEFKFMDVRLIALLKEEVEPRIDELIAERR